VLDFNVGEAVTRLRNALGVRGRMPLGLDEHVVPTVTTADVTTPPWRRDGIRYIAAQRASTVTVGNFGQILFHLGFSDPNIVFVVDTIVLQALDFVIASGALLPNARAVGNLAAVRQNSIVSTSVYTAEKYPGPATTAELLLNAGFRFTDSATDPSIPVGRFVDLTGPGPLVLPCQLPISGTMELQFGSTNAATAANASALAVVVSGLVYGVGGS
jgi:hypothetical protein